MRYVAQPPQSNLCGQACVAMIADIPLEESIAVFGKRGCTKTKDVAAALRKLGIPCDDKVVRLKQKESPINTGTVIKMAVLHHADWTHQSHWIVVYGNLYYDPACGIVGDEYVYTDKVRITSYLPVYLTEVAA